MAEHIQAAIRAAARRLLAGGEIGYFIGWGATRFAAKTAPRFIFKAGDADQLVFNEHCLNTLAKYLLDDKFPRHKIGLCARGCDSRAINRLLADKQIKRENIYIIGIPCPGMREQGRPAAKCALCAHKNPLLYDELIGPEVEESAAAGRFAAVEALEQQGADQRYEFWARQYDKCLRCYACRNVCPACNCGQCYADQHRTAWQSRQHSRAENQLYGLTRAFHIGDRCVECGECERVCPMGLPLMTLNRKPVKDVGELFGITENGLDADSTPALGAFIKDDLDEFM